MPTTNVVGPDYDSGIGYVTPNGLHRKGNGQGIPAFQLPNASAVVASGDGALKLEWYAEGGLTGGRWGVYMAAFPEVQWYYLGELEYTGKSPTPPTFNSATTRTASKKTTPVQFNQLTVPNATLAAIDGVDFMQLRFEPRDGVGLILTASELTYTS